MSIKIDKSVFTPEELNTYKALIAKATVDVEAAEEEMSEERPDFPPKKKRVEFEEEEVETEKCNTRKSADPQLTAAMERLETLEKSIALQEMTEIAKKYTVLGENEEELAKTLYDMKKSNEENYNAYIAVLDKSLGLVEKSGIFAEIGKSTGAYGAAAGAVGKVEAIASDIMKSDTSMTREQAIAKAWEDHPELIAEYDREYRR
jgi:hypothetical protein